MSRRRRPKRQISESLRIPPIELDDLRCRNAPAFEVCSHPERSNEGEIAFFEGDDRRVVEVIVVVMREHYRVERRQVAESEQRREPALWSRESRRPDPL